MQAALFYPVLCFYLGNFERITVIWKNQYKQYLKNIKRNEHVIYLHLKVLLK